MQRPLIKPLMRPRAVMVLLFAANAAPIMAQEAAPETRTVEERRGWLSRVMHPFGSSERLPDYKDARLRGLVLDLQLTPAPLKLSEVRHLQVHLSVINKSKKPNPITLEFPTQERIEIFLRNSAEVVLTKFSDNHSYENTPGTVLINPGEHVDYDGAISTRDLTPNKVFICEIFFPQYPELRVRQKFLTEP
jgi:hypothetical protein